MGGGHSVDAAVFAVLSEVDDMLKQRTVPKSNTAEHCVMPQDSNVCQVVASVPGGAALH